MATDAQTDSGAAYERALQNLVRNSPLRIFMLSLPDSRLLEVSDPMAEFSQRPRGELLTLRLIDLVAEPDLARHSMSQLAEGKLDSYTRQSRYVTPSGESLPITVRITAPMNQCPRTRAVGLVFDPEMDDGYDDLPEVASQVGRVLGTVDNEWRIDRITSEVSGLLDIPPSEIIGSSTFSVVHPEDISALLIMAGHATAHTGGASGRIRLRNAADEWVMCRLSLLPLAGEELGGFAFSVGPPDGERPAPIGRIRELEESLRRIASEITASGVAAMATAMPTALEVPELGSLTSREYEIVVRLVGGERVPAIARRLFLSESTVRNHLTTVYRKFGVSSQGELLARLRPSEHTAGAT
ncbi:MAG: hypothetical protein QOE64_2014 [Frankiales bacterium]|nr:hypothetical protein [Frankiales bacterium]